ncbi:MAG: hypothetical protein RRZ68_04280, partial [Oscillospiraceae bacterium]
VADIQNYVNGIQISDVTPSEIKIIPTYRVFANAKWYDWVNYYNEHSYDGYAGVDNNSITAIMIKLSQGHIRYRTSLLSGVWLDWVTDCNNDNYNGYAGIKGKPFDKIQMELIGLDDYVVEYRASNNNDINYLPWVRNYNDINCDGFAGIKGKPIDKIQIRIIHK